MTTNGPVPEMEPHLHVVPGLLAVGADAERNAEEAAEAASELTGGDIADADQVSELLGAEVAERITGLVSFLTVEDPVASARAVDEADPTINAAPVHGLAPMWHNFSDAGAPNSAADIDDPKVSPGSRQRVIAVVDSGIVPNENLPTWMSSSIIRDAEDVEVLNRDEVSHGTFGTSILRQVAPTYMVSMARVAPYEGTVLEPADPSHTAPPHPTTEAHVSAEIQRLIDRHRDDEAVEALHLGLGGQSLFPGRRKAMVLLSAALDRWREAFPKCAPVFAAAGNVQSAIPVYPAAFREVRGVAAGGNRGNGQQVVWDPSGAPTGADYRYWVDDVAPGHELRGLSGRAPSDAVTWRGSSFATSVATALYVSSGPRRVHAGVTYWPDRVMDYADVPGLLT